MEFILMLMTFILPPAICTLQRSWHEGRIDRKISSIGGKVISIEHRYSFSGSRPFKDLGPFKIAGRGRYVYRIKFEAAGR